MRAALLLLIAMPCLAAGDSAPTAEDVRLFDLLKARSLAARGLPASAAASSAAPDPSLPENDPAAIQRRFAEGERERASAFDKQFGEGAFAGIVNFSKHCLSTNGCDRLATVGLIEGAYHFVSLEKEVEKGLSPRSPDYAMRRGNIIAGMKPYLERLPPNKAMSADAAAERLKVLGPIAKGILSKKELADFRARNP